MKRPIEYRAFTKEGRLMGRERAVVETTEDKHKTLRSLGCPQEIIDRVERRNAALVANAPTVVPANAELDALRAQLAAQAQIPATN